MTSRIHDLFNKLLKFFERDEDITLNSDENSRAIVLIVPANKKTALHLNGNPKFHHDVHLPEKKGSSESIACRFFPTGLLKLVVNNYFLP